ncbi:polyprenyl synthetase family protein [Magnetovibrio sp. PR-2]|uniref:polyprenyl synthetase family protein n=1 Tax=Magnetovibrio sp. PR-2 TaxID=3120356 RepID=UPI002FCDE282
MGVVVNLDEERKKASPLDRLSELLEDDLKAANQEIVERMHSPVSLIPQLAGHIIAAGGKRLRPLLTIASARMCGYTGDRHILLSACIEFIHTATLLHDDVVDESDLRRGEESANAIWGNKASVLVGDFLFTRAFELMVGDGDLEVLRILSEGSSTLAEGEVLQLVTANDTETNESAYMEVIEAKTAELFAAAAELGPVVADRPKHEQDAMRAYGMNLGIAFQLVDDVLDFSAKQEQLGKAVGDDFREGKITLPIILAFARGTDEERAFWKRTMEELDQNENDLDHAMGLLGQHNALTDTAERARHYGAIARDSLGIFPESEIKTALLDVIDFVIERAY